MIATEIESQVGPGTMINIGGWVMQAVRPLTLEEKAIQFGESSQNVIKSLRNALKLLNSDIRTGFGKGKLHLDSKCLKGLNGILRWKLRVQPNQPISYENQQTSIGVVVFEFLTPER